MKKKIALGAISLVAVAGGVAGLSAFEAHVINVTARIENALQVDTTPINFGTVFPQEFLVKDLHVELSDSFLEERDADDVEYIIRQKPKCGWTTDDGEVLVGSTMSGEVDDQGEITCPDPVPPTPPVAGATWGQLPLLCPYLSKHKDPEDTDTNDSELDAFHKIGEVTPAGWVWNDVKGRLAKSQQDTIDWWVIDLAVPCFGEHCAQDWAEFVGKYNPNEEENADEWVADSDDESKVFGCDLWIEVTGVSRFSATSTPET